MTTPTHTQENKELPPGWEEWKRIGDVMRAAYTVIATKDDMVGFFYFDGIADMPTHISQHYVIKRPVAAGDPSQANT